MNLRKNLFEIRWHLLAIVLLAFFANETAALLSGTGLEWLALTGNGVAVGLVLPKRDKHFRPAELNPGTTTILGTTFEKELPGNFPLEGIDIVCDLTLGATAPSSLTTDGLPKLVKRVEIESRSPIAPGVIVNSSGVGLLELAAQTQMNLDTATLATISKNISGYTASEKHRIVYHIPFCPPQIKGQLRSRFMLDCHNHKQPPKIKIDFATAAEMYGAGSLSIVNVEIVLRRRFMNDAINQRILDTGGYIPTDLLEQVHAPGAGVSGERAFKLFVKGKMLGVLMRLYKGGASVTRGDISEVTTLGSESVWKLDIGGTPYIEWTMKSLKALNEKSRPLNAALIASSPQIGAALASATNYQDPSSLYHDFLTDENGTAEELGSVLDVDEQSAQNNECNIIGNIANTATNGHTVYLLGQRILRADISQWQAR